MAAKKAGRRTDTFRMSPTPPGDFVVPGPQDWPGGPSNTYRRTPSGSYKVTYWDDMVKSESTVPKSQVPKSVRRALVRHAWKNTGGRLGGGARAGGGSMFGGSMRGSGGTGIRSHGR